MDHTEMRTLPENLPSFISTMNVLDPVIKSVIDMILEGKPIDCIYRALTVTCGEKNWSAETRDTFIAALICCCANILVKGAVESVKAPTRN